MQAGALAYPEPPFPKHLAVAPAERGEIAAGLLRRDTRRERRHRWISANVNDGGPMR